MASTAAAQFLYPWLLALNAIRCFSCDPSPIAIVANSPASRSRPNNWLIWRQSYRQGPLSDSINAKASSPILRPMVVWRSMVVLRSMVVWRSMVVLRSMVLCRSMAGLPAWWLHVKGACIQCIQAAYKTAYKLKCTISQLQGPYPLHTEHTTLFKGSYYKKTY